MEAQQDNYNISFFKPTTVLAKKNARITIILISIWAVAVFGFQILLKIIEEPTPEPAYIAFENVWDNVKAGKASAEEYSTFLKSTLSVTGKLSLADNDREILNKAISDVIFKVANDNEAGLLKEKMNSFYSLEGVNIQDENYLKLKNEFSQIGASIIGLETFSTEAKLIPFAVKTFEDPAYKKEAVEDIMSKYLIHNQSFITDAKIFGFPFHYFYTAVFLLILFVGLCWIFCVRTDKIYKKLNIEERI